VELAKSTIHDSIYSITDLADKQNKFKSKLCEWLKAILQKFQKLTNFLLVIIVSK